MGFSGFKVCWADSIGFLRISLKNGVLPHTQIPGGSEQVRTTRGVISRQGFEHNLSYKKCQQITTMCANQHFENGVEQLSIYWPRNPPLWSFYFLRDVSGCATSDFRLGDTPGEILVFGAM